jgi:ATP-dependent DNA helicase RecG
MKELMGHFNYKHRKYFVNKYIKPLLESNKLGLTIPDKPNSRNQKDIKK